MTRSDFLLFALTLADGRPFSPVQVQKTMFLFSQLLPGDVLPKPFYGFVPHNYGPFSSEIYHDALSLSRQGLVTILEERGKGYPEYCASGAGIQRGRALAAELKFEVRDHAQRIVDWVRSQSFRGLVSAIYVKYPEYAAKSIFKVQK